MGVNKLAHLCQQPLPVVIPAKRLRVLGMLAGAFLFMLGSIWLLNTDQPLRNVPTGVIRLVGVVGVAVFGVFFLMWLYALFFFRTVLRIEDAGITDSSSLVYFGFIAWQDISQIKQGSGANSAMILVELRNMDDYLAKMPNWKRAYWRVSQLIENGVFISPTASSLSSQEMLELLRYHWCNYQQQQNVP